MKRTVLIFVAACAALVISGCTTTSEDIEIAIRACSSHGGFKSQRRVLWGRVTYCNDGTVITMIGTEQGVQDEKDL